MRKMLFAGLAVALVLVGLVLPLVVPWHCPVNRVNSERIKEGMTQAEVETILGGPPGDYRTLPRKALFFMDVTSWPPGLSVEMWVGDTGDVLVGFTAEGLVARVEFNEDNIGNLTSVAVARWRLEQLKERWFP
jgi:hypothetical protein